MNWRLKKQLTILAIVFLFIGGVIFLFSLKLFPEPTCFDNIKNQEETGVDCGGSCVPCALKYPKNITIFWTKFVKFSPETFDVVADIKNPNDFLAAANLSYQFELVDRLGAVVAIREGETFLLPGDEVHIIENNLKTTREPAVVKFKITGANWTFEEATRPDLIVGERNIKKTEENGTLNTVINTSIQNRSVLDFGKVEIKIILLDREENLLGAKKTVERTVLAGEKRSLEASWPQDFGELVKIIRVEPRTNILDKSNILRR